MNEWTPPNAAYPLPKADEPAIHRAARLGDADAIRRLAAEGADLNQIFDLALDPGGRSRRATPLMVAAGSGDGADVETVKLLLELGADPKRTVDDESAAAFACAGLGWNDRPGGDVKRLKFLLATGSLLPSNPAKANRLVCGAAATGDAERLEVLLSAGLSGRGYFDPAGVEARAQELNASICGAALSPELESIMTPELREMMDKTTREMNERLVAAPWSHEIPLFCAAQSGNADCVRLLLNAGADPTARDNSKRTAMYHANSSAVVQSLRDVGVPLEDADEYGWTPLVAALCEGETALPRLRALLDAGADVNGTHDRGYTVFMSAVGSGRYPEALRLLVAAGADPHAVSELDYNAFHAAIDVNGEANDEASVRDTLGYLKELGVDLEHRNHVGCTPLARAIQEGTGLEVQVLCELGADPNAVCPLRVCGGNDCESVDQPLLFQAVDGFGVHRDAKTEALLKAGANPLVEDAEGFTPLVRAVAALCSDAEDYEASFSAFFAGLGELEQVSKTPGQSREEFVAAVSKIVRPYVERFAATIPISDQSEFAGEWRKERISCIASLYAYEQWGQPT